ncbi:UNVERIFIED_CONTAM: hypothetical protein GTU68_041661 [Idotea baltica]|nr:hypothetical protein [Idotea baltica]
MSISPLDKPPSDWAWQRRRCGSTRTRA